MNDCDLILRTAAALQQHSKQISAKKALVGFDGFVDEIISVVDKRESPTKFRRMETMTQIAQRVADAAGKSANIELVVERVKLGGNGPIMANAMASFGAKTTYVGAVGYPKIHPVFEPFAARTRVFSFCEPAHTDALEFRDGKIMLGKHASVKDVSWENLSARVGKARLRELLNESSLVSMNNWTMLPLMSDIWAHLQREICPKLDHSKERIAFFDLADPTKRKPADLKRAIQLIKGFQRWFKTVLGVNKRESALVAQVLGLPPHNDELESVKATAAAIQSRLKLDAVVVHTREYAMSASGGDVVVVASAFAEKPLISTGAGDHFNAGYCIGRLLGFDAPMALKTGTSVANYYVRTAESPNCGKLVPFLKSLAKSAR